MKNISEQKENTSVNTNGQKEFCVICGVETEYTRDVSVFKRDFYVSSAGQLCRECYCELYIKKDVKSERGI